MKEGSTPGRQLLLILLLSCFPLSLSLSPRLSLALPPLFRVVAFLALRGPRTANSRKHVIPYSTYHTHYVGYLPPNQVEFIAGKCQFRGAAARHPARSTDAAAHCTLLHAGLGCVPRSLDPRYHRKWLLTRRRRRDRSVPRNSAQTRRDQARREKRCIGIKPESYTPFYANRLIWKR